MKRLLVLLAVFVAALSVVSVAAAKVQRNQMQTMTFTATQPKDVYGQWQDVWTHTYSVTLNPCDGSFVGGGTAVGTGVPFYTTEAITGNFDGATLNYTATYIAPGSDTGVKYALSGPVADPTNILIAHAWDALGNLIDTSPNSLEFKISGLAMVNFTTYATHGDYVSFVGGGDDAAHSCIGMPIIP
jgi:hypothetical protein